MGVLEILAQQSLMEIITTKRLNPFITINYRQTQTQVVSILDRKFSYDLQQH